MITCNQINMDKGKKTIVMLGVGEEYLKNFNETFRPSIEAYAKRIRVPTIVIEEVICPSKTRIYWQRFLLFSHPRVAENEKILMLDSDIYITKHAKNIFDAVGNYPWGICKNNAYDLPKLAITDMYCYEDCPEENRPDFLTNSGMYVISKEYKDSLEKIYNQNQIKEARGFDMGPLSYLLLNDGKGIILPPEFNTLVVSYIEKYGCSLSSVLKMYDDNSFLHFAASKWRSIFYFVRWFDTTDSEFAKRIVRFFGRNEFNFITSRLFKIFQWSFGVYGYRFKKYFS